jgi:hypothetical protein
MLQLFEALGSTCVDESLDEGKGLPPLVGSECLPFGRGDHCLLSLKLSLVPLALPRVVVFFPAITSWNTNWSTRLHALINALSPFVNFAKCACISASGVSAFRALRAYMYARSYKSLPRVVSAPSRSALLLLARFTGLSDHSLRGPAESSNPSVVPRSASPITER